MREQQHSIVTFAHQQVLGCIADVPDTFRVQVLRYVQQLSHECIDEVFLGHQCRMVVEQLCQRHVVALLHQQPHNIAAFRDGLKVQLVLVNQFAVSGTICLQGLRELDVVVQLGVHIEHVLVFLAHLLLGKLADSHTRQLGFRTCF